MNSLAQNWLALELDSVDQEFEEWSEGVKASYNSLFDASDLSDEREVFQPAQASPEAAVFVA